MRIRAANALFTVLYLAFAIAGGFAFQRFDHERLREAKAYQRQRQASDELARFLAGATQISSSVQAFTATRDSQFSRAYWQEVEVTRSREQATQALLDLDLTDDESGLIAEAKARSDSMIGVGAQAITAAEEGDRARAIQLVFGPAYQRALQDVLEPTRLLRHMLETRLNTELAEERRLAQAWWRLCLALALLNLLLVVGVLVLVYPRFLAWPLLRLNQRVQALLAGGQPAPLDLGHAATEIRELAVSLEAYQAMADQMGRDQWAKAQQVRITAALQRLHDPAALARCFLGEMAPLLGIASATFYVRDPGAEQLHLVGSYALADPAAVPVLIRFGEGLVGEVACQGQPIQLDNPPARYLEIVSGTGAAPAAVVLVLPVASSEQLLAVIELAALQPLAPHQQHLLTDLLPLLALALEALPPATLLPPQPQPATATPTATATSTAPATATATPASTAASS
ncbi:GAF domain-containing protein [Vulcanococcus limneticus]|uniref:GAF domain-containing protein n=1 Tax=Vulcanococcus limneticus TaxID=2170428 RepID=UPI00398BCF46